jgi:hypothetical protein
MKAVMRLVEPTQIVIEEEEYKSLQEYSDFLQCLINAGVDNWSGYNFAVDLNRGLIDE